MDKNKEIILANSTSNHKVELQTFENNLMLFINDNGLPAENVLVLVIERVKIFTNFKDILSLLQDDHKQASIYLSKFVAAAGAGLFDAALNYLWDETIFQLRKRVAKYDLEYFFDLAVNNSEKRKKFTTEEDISKLEDNELIRGANEIGLISALGFKHLDYIRYMRNWVSAAHPNQNQITGLQLIAWLETCIKEVITLPETSSTTHIKLLLANIKSHAIDATTKIQISSFFVQLTTDQSNNLIAGFFGIYTNEKSFPLARDNIKQLAPLLWPFVSETTRKNFGEKYGQFAANHDPIKANWAREFLDIVSAASYIPDAIRAAEIGMAIDGLLSAHNGLNNFHIEPSFARSLESLVGEKGQVPTQVIERYVDGLITVFLTNGHGIAWSAEPIYYKLLALFDATQALMAVLSFRKIHITSKLQFPICAEKYKEIIKLASTKVTSPQGIEIISLINDYKAPLENMRNETKLMEKVNAITKSIGF